MGQRLVITIERSEKPIAAIYYHWSAYTYSALLETKKVVDCIYNHKEESDSDMLLRLIKFLESNGGGIRGTEDGNEHKYIQSLYPNETFKQEGYSRNDGIIALSEKGITEMQRWSEGDVFIDLDTDEIDFCVFSAYDSLEEYIREMKECDDEFDESELGEVPKLDCDLGYIKVEDIDYTLNAIYNTSAHVVECNGIICELIE